MISAQQCHQFLVDLTSQYHLYHIDSILVCIPQTADELIFNVQTVQHIGNFRAAAMYQNHFYPHERQQNNVAHDCLFQFFVGHCISAILDNYNFIVVFLNIRQSIYQYLCTQFIIIFLHLESPLSLFAYER